MLSEINTFEIVEKVWMDFAQNEKLKPYFERILQCLASE